MNFADAAKENGKWTRTENDAVALNTTGDALLDLFGTIGALREAEEVRITRLFAEAYRENPLLATKIAFYGRDVRGGLGERQTFRTLMRSMAEYYPGALRPNLDLVGVYGRYDDLYTLVGTPLEEDMWAAMKRQFEEDRAGLANDKGAVSLLAKWIKTADSSSEKTRRLGILTALKLGYRVSEFKRLVRAMRKRLGVVEALMSAGRWDEIRYSAVPSRAMLIYRKSFLRHDEERYRAFIDRAVKGEETIHSGTLFPYDIVERMLYPVDPENLAEQELAEIQRQISMIGRQIKRISSQIKHISSQIEQKKASSFAEKLGEAFGVECADLLEMKTTCAELEATRAELEATRPELEKKRIEAEAKYADAAAKNAELKTVEQKTLEAQWRQLPNYVAPGTNALVIADTSGSMEGRPMATSVGLAIYFAERNTGAYHNMWMSFSGESRIHLLKGETLAQKIASLDMDDWGMNTNLRVAFEKVLDIAMRHHVPPEEMPKSLIVISDMEIDHCGDRDWTFHEQMTARFRELGYELPNVIFWNVNSRHDVFHADAKRRGVQLVSGQSASVFRQVMDCVGLTPLEAMLKILNVERYAAISVEA